ncbi:NAD(P)/FAD-dependent oxidoreductase [Halomarina pelagica]|uniref:NAD(P)/FAD-dependent oxidoreductase n=1 Tax=Halomarina pelagica TaxID=2961599 RepID=UPI0020C54682|nr:FAD-dependent oxidoreductase [Halomarina sp. BND7]
MRTAVLGAGAIGTTAAYDLATRGADVTVFERESVAAGSSGRASGLCYDAYAGRTDAAVGDRALERFRELSGTGDFEFTDRPYVWLAREGDERRAAAIREQVGRMREHGRNVSLLSKAALADRFSALETDDVAVAAVAENAGHADPASYAAAMADRAREAGATIRERTPATLREGGDGNEGPVVETDGGRESFDAVLVAAGAHTRRVLAAAGIAVPLKPYRVQALVTGPTPVRDRDALPMLFDATGGYYLRPYGAGLLVGDGTEPVERDPDDWDRGADDWFVEDCAGYLASALGEALGAEGDEGAALGAGGATALPVERAWAGLCTATPDGDPLLGECAPGVYVAAGWQGHGFMRAPALGEVIAEGMLGGEGIGGFAPTRFDGSEDFEIVEGMDVAVEPE